MKYRVKNKGDEDKVSQALARMTAEDVTLKAVNDSENRQSLLYGMGEQHLEIVASKLGEASMKPFLNARIVAILNAISEESTG